MSSEKVTAGPKQKWFAWCDDEMYFVESEQQAIDMATNAIAECREASDEEWIDDVNHICYGIVVGESRCTEVSAPSGDYCRFAIEKLHVDSDRHVSNLVMLVGRLVQQVRKHDQSNDVTDKAMDYLRRADLVPSIIRDVACIGGE